MTRRRTRATVGRNATASTGPKSKEGKARSSRNAFRHGLAQPLVLDARLHEQLEKLTGLIAAPRSYDTALHAARCIAETQIDLLRIQGVRQRAYRNFVAASPSMEFDATAYSFDDLMALVYELERVERYRKRALARRKAAMLSFDAIIDVTVPWP
jgi:hypothetical protein